MRYEGLLALIGNEKFWKAGSYYVFLAGRQLREKTVMYARRHTMGS
jgi:hypothetical protein